MIEKTFGSLGENDQLKVTWSFEFKEPVKLTPLQEVLKIYNDAAEYMKGYRLILENWKDESWD